MEVVGRSRLSMFSLNHRDFTPHVNWTLEMRHIITVTPPKQI